MLKKIFKFLLKSFIGLVLFALLTFGGFHLWEYVTGGKYVDYLAANSETVPIESNFSYSELGKDVANNQLILVGEIHGFDEPCKFDVDFFKYLHERHHVDHYIAELDYVQAALVNDFLKSGDEAILEKALEKWAVIQGRNNQDYFDKFRALHLYYQELTANDKFEVIGVDHLQDISLTKDFLYRYLPTKDSLQDASTSVILDFLTNLHQDKKDTLFVLNHLKTNLKYLEDKESREEVLFQNFKNQYDFYELSDARLYGFLGLYHVFQYRVNGTHPFASKIRTSDLGLTDKILSINVMMNDSYMVMPSNQLPEFMRDSTAFSRLPVSSDNMLFMYLIGVKDFKRMTPEHHKSLIKMNGENSPYADSDLRMNKAIQLLPVTDIMEMDDKGKPYVQYTLFVRNSDWAEPML